MAFPGLDRVFQQAHHFGVIVLEWDAQDFGDVAGGEPDQPDAVNGEDVIQIAQAALAFHGGNDQGAVAGFGVELRELVGGGEAAQVDQAVPVVAQAHQFLDFRFGVYRYGDRGGA